MAKKRSFPRIRLAFLGGVLALVSAGGIGACLTPSIQAKFFAYRYRNATEAEARNTYADRLISIGETGIAALIAEMTSPATSVHATGAIERQLNAYAPEDPRGKIFAVQVLEACPPAAVLELMPALLKKLGPEYDARCREFVGAGLALPETTARLTAIRRAMHPRIDLCEKLLPLLESPDVQVRRAVLFAIGPVSDINSVIEDEELFAWLHDSDAEVRSICRDALMSRGLSASQISLGGRLANPDAAERLKLLADLRFEDEEIRDPEPWLERLSRDSNPAIRAGAARIAVERKLSQAKWLVDLITNDPDASVRQVAGYYQSTSMRSTIRTATGP